MLMLDEGRGRRRTVQPGRITRAAFGVGRRLVDLATRIVAGPETDAGRIVAGALGVRI